MRSEPSKTFMLYNTMELLYKTSSEISLENNSEIGKAGLLGVFGVTKEFSTFQGGRKISWGGMSPLLLILPRYINQ